MAKRIQMRKNKFDALRKMAEERAKAAGIMVPEKKPFGCPKDVESGNPELDKLAKKIENLYGIAPSDIDR